MSDLAIQPETPAPSHTRRVLILVGIVLLAVAAVWFLRFTDTGREMFTRDHARQWTAEHRLIAPIALIVIYILLAILALPVWWLQILAGVCFGLYYGGGLCLIAATLGSGLTAWLAQWSAGDFFAARVESKMAKLRWLEEKVDRNGFVVVLLVRMLHLLPFGISNYILGLFHVPVRTIMLGTLIGGIPAIALYVALGTTHPMQNKPVFFTIIALNVIALALIPVRYLRPQWFRKLGIE